MITLYALENSRAWRIAWLLECLQCEYRVETLGRDAKSYLAPERLRRIHPLGKSPLLQDGERVLAESGAIVEYLIARYGAGSGLKPAADSPGYDDYLFWLHYAEGSLMPLLVTALLLRKIDARPMPFFARPIARKITQGVREGYLHPQLALHLGFVEERLAGNTWLLGDALSGADIMMSFPLQAALARTTLALPHIAAYVARIEAEPHYRRAEARLGKLAL